MGILYQNSAAGGRANGKKWDPNPGPKMGPEPRPRPQRRTAKGRGAGRWPVCVEPSRANKPPSAGGAGGLMRWDRLIYPARAFNRILGQCSRFMPRLAQIDAAGPSSYILAYYGQGALFPAGDGRRPSDASPFGGSARGRDMFPALVKTLTRTPVYVRNNRRIIAPTCRRCVFAS